MLIMDESRPWLPALSSEILSLDPIRLVFSFVMSKKVPRGNKHRDEIVQMEEGSRTHSHRWDASALEGVPLVRIPFCYTRVDRVHSFVR